MTAYCDVTNSAYPVTIITIRDCSILEFGRGAYNQSVVPHSTRPLQGTLYTHISPVGLAISKNPAITRD